MTKSVNVGTSADGDKREAGAEILGNSDTPTIRITDASDDRDTVTAAAITQTLSRCLLPASDSINSSVYILGKGNIWHDVFKFSREKHYKA